MVVSATQARAVETTTGSGTWECDELLGSQQACPEVRRSPWRIAATAAAGIFALAVGICVGAAYLGQALPTASGSLFFAHATPRNGTCVDLPGVRLPQAPSAALVALWHDEVNATSEQCTTRCRDRTDCEQAVFAADSASCSLYSRAAAKGSGARWDEFNSSLCGGKEEHGRLAAAVYELKRRSAQGARFQQVRHGSCADVDALPVTDEATCNHAAEQLGLENATAHRMFMEGRPEGCYLYRDPTQEGQEAVLYVNLSPKSAGRGAQPQAGRVQICKAKLATEQCARKGENCLLSQCCAAPGHQCYQRDAAWGACLPSCTETQWKHGWTCHTLGDRTPMKKPVCATNGEDCTRSMCCSMPGLQCYEKSSGWGSCQVRCEGADWTCKTLGPRTPLRNLCSWPGQECSLTKLCCKPGHSCFAKDRIESYCTASADKTWLGTVLGHSRWEYPVAPAPPGQGAGTSLFCFMAYLPDSNEVGLLQAAKSRKASIFACEAFATFKAWRTQFVSLGSWKSVVNIDVFVHIWNSVKQDGRFAKHDFTVKVDPDSVYFPDRLRWHLKKLNPPRNVPLFIKNVATGFGLFGAIEVFNRLAMLKYQNNSKECLKTVGSFGGEDGFVKGCMDMIGAGYMTDIDVLRQPKETSCGDGARVCFHPFKDVGSWVGCYNTARR